MSVETNIGFEIWSPQDERLMEMLERLNFPIQSIWLKTEKMILGCALGVVAVEEAFGCWVVCGDPLPCDGVKSFSVLEAFVHWSHSEGKCVCGYYFSKELAQHSDMVAVQAGVSRGVELKGFSLSGYHQRDVRRALNQGRRNHLEFLEIPEEKKTAWFTQLKMFEDKWAATKKGPRIGFILSELKERFLRSGKERWFVVKDSSGEVQAFITVLGLSASKEYYYVDQMVQVPGGQKFALDFLLARVILQLQNEGVGSLWLGLCVFARLRLKHGLEWIFQMLGYIRWLYPARGLYLYKKKFTDIELERYLIFDPKFGYLRQLFALAKTTYPQIFSSRRINKIPW